MAVVAGVVPAHPTLPVYDARQCRVIALLVVPSKVQEEHVCGDSIGEMRVNLEIREERRQGIRTQEFRNNVRNTRVGSDDKSDPIERIGKESEDRYPMGTPMAQDGRKQFGPERHLSVRLLCLGLCL